MKCVNCNGTGRVKEREITGDDLYDDGYRRCDHCDGLGSRVEKFIRSISMTEKILSNLNIELEIAIKEEFE